MSIIICENVVVKMNHGSYGSTPREITAAAAKCREEVERNPDAWFRSNLFTRLDATRKRIAEYVNAPDQDDIVFVDNASQAVNCVLRSLRFEQHEVLLLNIAYPMTKHAAALALDRDHRYAQVQTLTINLPSSNDEIIQTITEYLDSRPEIRLCEFSHITSNPVLILPVGPLSKECRRRGVLTLIDGAHALGQIPIDLQEIDADFYTANGHKWLYSARGSAILYARKELQALLVPPVISSRAGHTCTFQDQFAYVGTKDYSSYMTMADALDFRERIGGDVAIMSYLKDLCKKGCAILKEAWGTESLVEDKDEDEQMAAMCNVRLPTLPERSCEASLKKEILQKLEERNTTVPLCTFQDEIYCRVSAALYLEESDFEFLAATMLDVISSLS